MKKNINICIFCEKDLTKEKFRENYILVPWRNDPGDIKSFNKIAKCCHPKCLEEFIDLNFNQIKDILLKINDQLTKKTTLK